MKETAQHQVVDILKGNDIDLKVSVSGWVRTIRNSKNVVFIALSDGSSFKNLQVVVEPSLIEKLDIATGTSLAIQGKIKKSEGTGQSIELEAARVDLLGMCDPEKYPLQPKKHSMEFLRSMPHLRMRTNTFRSIFKIRSEISYAIHDFFYKKSFCWLHTPIITAIDAEGAGEMFNIENPKGIEGDFFGKKAHLTVSGQLAAETAALAMSKVYTFGPTFRAENSNTSRHLAEFWMIEPEVAFNDLKENINLATAFLKHIIKHTLENCSEELDFLNKAYINAQKQKPANIRDEEGLIDGLDIVLSSDFEIVSYTEAIEILKNSKPNKKKKFKFPIEKWGADLQSEHEKFLTDTYFKKPVVITDYPKDIKAFYMYQNDDGKTVAAMDIIFPRLGEVVGGSQREHRLDRLKQAIHTFNIIEEEMHWYLDTRRFGSVIHSGFGLGFERIVQYICGLENIRDTIPFPRARGLVPC